MSEFDTLKKELTRDEGLRLHAYKDSVGLWTIGIGHLLGPERRMSQITKEEANALFELDISESYDLVEKICPDLSPFYNSVRWRVLMNMAFNLGSRLYGFKKFLAAVNAKNWEIAALEMADSKWATQVGDRATRLIHMMRTGETA